MLTLIDKAVVQAAKDVPPPNHQDEFKEVMSTSLIHYHDQTHQKKICTLNKN